MIVFPFTDCLAGVSIFTKTLRIATENIASRSGDSLAMFLIPPRKSGQQWWLQQWKGRRSVFRRIVRHVIYSLLRFNDMAKLYKNREW